MPWWQRGVIYQIYPRSFQDSDGDGVGDLNGVRARLDYLASLNVDALWLSPIFTSPMQDFGYDVADYQGIDPLFGTLEDFDGLLQEAHAREMKVMLDLVPNHTSEQHPWFLEARAGKGSPKRDWYIWHDPAPGGGPPNNWLSFFGGRAWTLDSASGQYYLHQFLPGQPELNWANPEVRAAIYDAMRFWLARGVDGFRVDVIWLLGKSADLPDEPENPLWKPGEVEHGRLTHIHTQDRPETHAYIREMRAVLDEFAGDRMMVGEIYLPLEQLMTYYGTPEAPECQLPFNFLLLSSPWNARAVADLANRYDALCRQWNGWPNWVLGNHDQTRFKSRLGADQYRVAQTLLLTLRGTPTVYYGDEIGMQDVAVPFERMRDPAGLQQPDIPDASRDPERTPMQWDASENAGFTNTFSGAEPWLPLAENFAEVNVAVQDGDPASDLNYFRALTALRRERPELSAGDYREVPLREDDVFAFARELAGARVLVLLNFGGDTRRLELDEGEAAVLLSSAGRTGRVSLSALELAGHEALIVGLKA